MGISGVCITMTDSWSAGEDSDGYHWSLHDYD